MVVSEREHGRVLLLVLGDGLKIKREVINIIGIEEQGFVKQGINVMLLLRERRHGETRESISHYVLRAGEILEFGRKFFQKKAPMKQTTGLEVTLS